MDQPWPKAGCEIRLSKKASKKSVISCVALWAARKCSYQACWIFGYELPSRLRIECRICRISKKVMKIIGNVKRRSVSRWEVKPFSAELLAAWLCRVSLHDDAIWIEHIVARFHLYGIEPCAKVLWSRDIRELLLERSINSYDNPIRAWQTNRDNLLGWAGQSSCLTLDEISVRNNLLVSQLGSQVSCLVSKLNRLG